MTPAPSLSIAMVVSFIALVIFGLAAPHLFYAPFVMKVLCLALFACSFNLLLGFGGLLSFGHAAFFGSAAYLSAHAAKIWHFPPEAAVLFATVCAGFLGLVFGLVAIRRQGIYFAMITLAMAQMIYFVAVQAKFTGGEDGIQAVPRGMLFGLFDLSQEMVMYHVVLAVFLIGFLIIYRTVHSPFGQVLKAIRENEARAVSLGYSADHYKLMAFVFSATLAGLAGSVKALVVQLASLTDVQWNTSGEVVLMTLLGGIGTIFGPVFGAALIVTIDEKFANGPFVKILTGLIFVICVLVFRRGIVGEAIALSRYLAKRSLRDVMSEVSALPRRLWGRTLGKSGGSH